MSAPEAFRLGVPRAETASFPVLDRVATRTARELGQMLSRLGEAAPVSLMGETTTRLDDWLNTLPSFAALARFRAAGLRHGLVLSVPPTLVTALVDRAYGGHGLPLSAGRTFGAAASRLFERLAQEAARSLASAWAEVHPVVPELAGCVASPGDLAFVSGEDHVVVQQFVVPGHAPIEIVYPVAAVRALTALARAEGAEVEEIDPAWRARLSAAVMQARLPVRTVVARPTLPLDRLMSLAPGDVIDVCLPAQVPLTVAGRLLAHGTIGEANGRAAIRVSTLEHGGFLE